MNGLNTSLTMINSDLRTLARDNFLTMVAGLTGLLLLGISITGIYRDALGLNHLQPWIPYILIMFLISNTATYGMLFGLVFVEEVETRVRAALAVIPVTLFKQTLIRTMSVFLWLIIQPVLFAGTVAAGWDAVPFGVFEWFVLSVSLAPLGAVFVIVLSTVASNRVEALAMGKFFSAATTPPMLLYLIAEDAWYRSLFLVFPTTPAVEAFEAFRTNDTAVAILWLVAGIAYALALGAYAMRRHIRKSYMISA